VLAAVAAAAEPITVQEVTKAVDASLSYNAVHTILRRLVDKGLVERLPAGRGQVYRTAQDAARVVARQMEALLLRGPDRVAVLRSFLSTLSDADERYLRERLDNLRGGDSQPA
jgi:predicted transcriptional regulator